jgi:Transposase
MLVFGKIRREILHEEEAIFCGADCGGVEAGRAGGVCGGGDSQGWDQRANLYRWKKQYVGLETDQARQVKQLQEENSRLKQLVADLSLDKTMLQDVLRKKF